MYVFNIMIIYISILIIACFIFFYFYYKQHNIYETFGFNNLDEDISDGNIASFSGRPNPFLYVNQRGQRDPIIYQAHGIPLIHEDHPTAPIPGDRSMFYFSNYSCKPECCQYSSDSCSNGCVCRGAQPEKYLTQNEAMTPHS
jgi:hypothetical protein